MPSTARDIINYCKQGNITSLELMGPVAEEFAGLPPSAPRPPRGAELTEEEKKAYICSETKRMAGVLRL